MIISRFLNFCWNLIYFQNETIVSLVFLLKNKKSREKAGELVGYFSRPPILLIIICGIVTCNNTGSALTRWFGFQNGNRFCCRNADTLYVHIYIYSEAAAQTGCTIYRHNFDRWILIIAKNERVTELPPPMYNRWILWANWERETDWAERRIKSNFTCKILFTSLYNFYKIRPTNIYILIKERVLRIKNYSFRNVNSKEI